MERSQREREKYNSGGIQRGTIRKIFKHCGFYYEQKKLKLIMSALQGANEKNILELGSTIWEYWLEYTNTMPAHIHCINISNRELHIGIKASQKTNIKPTFYLMDACRLGFRDEIFDTVIGDAILHHVDFMIALKEVYRVLKPNGRIIFSEPLRNNPFAMIIRCLTPKARTADEKPLGIREISEMQSLFDCKICYVQLFSVPCGILSGFMFKNPDNFLMRVAYKVDRTLECILPLLRYLYRDILVIGQKRNLARRCK